MPLMEHSEFLIVACADPTQHELLRMLSFLTGKPVEAVYADPQAVKRAINKHYGSVTVETLPEDDSTEPVLSLQQMQALAEDKPTVRFVDNLLEDAINQRASDIHRWPGLSQVQRPGLCRTHRGVRAAGGHPRPAPPDPARYRRSGYRAAGPPRRHAPAHRGCAGDCPAGHHLAGRGVPGAARIDWRRSWVSC